MPARAILISGGMKLSLMTKMHVAVAGVGLGPPPMAHGARGTEVMESLTCLASHLCQALKQLEPRRWSWLTFIWQTEPHPGDSPYLIFKQLCVICLSSRRMF